MVRKIDLKIAESKSREAAHVANFFEGFPSTDTAQLQAIRDTIPRAAAEVKSSGILPKVVRAGSRGWFISFLSGLWQK